MLGDGHFYDIILRQKLPSLSEKILNNCLEGKKIFKAKSVSKSILYHLIFLYYSVPYARDSQPMKKHKVFHHDPSSSFSIS